MRPVFVFIDCLVIAFDTKETTSFVNFYSHSI